MIKLIHGDYIATENMSRKQYNKFCCMLLAAGADIGEYQKFSDNMPRIAGTVSTQELGRYSNNFGLFEFVGWRYNEIIHFSGPVNVDRTRELKLSDIE